MISLKKQEKKDTQKISILNPIRYLTLTCEIL